MTAATTAARTSSRQQASRLVAVLLAARLRSLRHKVGGLLTHWPGRLACIGVVLVSARLLWILAAPPSARTPAIPDGILQDVLGVLSIGALTVWGSHSLTRAPVILNTGDIGVVDSGSLIRVSLTAGVLARLPAPAIGGLYLSAVLVGLAPAQWASLDSRLRLWAVLAALGAWMTSARLACGCATWAFPRVRPLLTLAWWSPAAELACSVLARVPEQGVGALHVLGRVFTVLTGHWLSAMLLAAATAVTHAVVMVLAPRLTPLWAAPAYQLAAILDLAESRDASAALALMRPARARSGRMPGFVRGAAAFAVRQWWETKRRHTGRAFVFEALAGYAAGRLVGWLLPEWWPLAFLIVGGFAASSCTLDGALAEARYPLFAAASSTRRSALEVGAWSCLLPASQAWAICLLTIFGGTHARVSEQTVGIALGCALTWPVIAAACSVAAALLSIRGVSNRLTGGVGGLSALGGPLTFAVGLGTSALAPGHVVLAAQVGTAALVSWALLHIALAGWSASHYTVRTNQATDLTDLSTTINSPAETEE
ncbi:hypothetical protein [Actinomyces ruminicola]|uniref:Uncharacterized protein n=1 Tax=Actinomyces ruminicola TaxID=332524 RepID=A0A1G9TU54_9ACTO|nr:hypothetical protein [Actinomyces ruminicola]SDM50765.1 hypothetical protein SAMN04487766_103126 [Actinomyces ruminicola]